MKNTRSKMDELYHKTNILDNEEINQLVNPIIYTRGTKSESFYLILKGKVMICSGNEGFLLEQTSFNYMGVDCLT